MWTKVEPNLVGFTVNIAFQCPLLSEGAHLRIQTVLCLGYKTFEKSIVGLTEPTMHPRNQLDATDELAQLSDPAFVEQVVTSDPFIDWNVELAINGIHLSHEEGARIFLQIHPYYAMEPRVTIPNPCPCLPSNLPDLWRSFVNSEWHRNDEPEPKIAGYSVLRQMLVPQSDPTDTTDTQPIWICGVPNSSRPNGICGQDFRRWDRAITHIRGKHLNHRPYPCRGGCGVPTW